MAAPGKILTADLDEHWSIRPTRPIELLRLRENSQHSRVGT
jgi:hypothetical protein